MLRSCEGDFDCAPPISESYLVEVRDPHAADLWVGRRVWVKGDSGEEIERRKVVIISSEFGIDSRDEEGI